MIHARPTFWGSGYTKDEHLHRISTRIRAEEVQEYLGEIKTEIWVKPRHLTPVKDGDYVDVLDDLPVIEELKKRPNVNVIAMSLVHKEYLEKELSNKIVLIYHHHINFERERHIPNKELLGGMIGTPSRQIYAVCDEIKKVLNFEPCFSYKTREDMIAYYKKIDYLIIWDFGERDCFYRHPTKIMNAASFGVPSFAIPLKGYQEVEGFYFPIERIEDINLTKITPEFCEKICAEAEKYHISNTTKPYLTL